MNIVTLITVGEAPSALASDLIALMPGAQIEVVAVDATNLIAAAAQKALKKGAVLVFSPVSVTLPEGTLDARKLLMQSVRTLTAGERVGVVTIAGNSIRTTAAWSAAGIRDIVTDSISCACSYDALRACALQLKSRGASVIALDDAAFTATEAAILAYDTSLEVISERKAAANFVMETVVNLPLRTPAVEAEPWCLAG